LDCPISREAAIDLLHQAVTEQIIGAAFEVHRILGFGFLERVYHRSMQVELELRGLKATIDDEIRVNNKAIEVGLLINFGRARGIEFKKFVI